MVDNIVRSDGEGEGNIEYDNNEINREIYDKKGDKNEATDEKKNFFMV